VLEQTVPFEVTSMDITKPFLLTLPKNRYLFILLDHFTKYVQAIPIPDQTPETCARLYTTQMVTRHGTGSKLVTDKGRAFMFTFLKNMQIIRNPPSKYRHQLPSNIKWNGRTMESITSHRLLAVCQASNANWDVLVPF